MKGFKIRLIALLLALSALFLTACGETPQEKEREDIHNREGNQLNYGMNYIVPDGFEKTKVTYSEFVYTDGVAYLYFDYYTPEKIEEKEMGFDPAISVYDYTRMFMTWNGIPMNSYTYDEEKNIGRIKWATGETEFGASEYFEWQIMRTEYCLYVATANCPEGKETEYADVFKAWFDSLYVE